MREGLGAALANLCVLGIPLLCGDAAALTRAHVVVFLLAAAVFAASETSAQRGRDRTSAGAGKLALATGLALLAVFWTALLVRGPVWLPGMGLGAGLMGTGIALRRAAMRALGARFVSEVRAAPASALLTDGIYARMRHPSETGLLCIAAGACVVLASPAGLAVCLALLAPLVIARARREDRELHALFGAPYACYAERVRPLL